MKKTTVLTLLLITALALHGCGNKKNVTDNMTNEETAALTAQQETTQLSTQETTAEQITDSETQEETTKETQEQTVAYTGYEEISWENVVQEEPAEPDNNSFAAGYAGASQYSQLVIVQSRGTRATVTMHEIQDGVWTEILRTDGYVGYMGVGQANEYSAITPQGTFPLYFAFGINPDPGTKVPYLQVDEYDYWVGDSSSPLYNQYVRTDGSETEWSKEESERIIDYPRAYGYCLFIGYNIEGTPHMGSCFFLHCSTGGPTAGCVSVSEADMAFILRNIGEDCGIVIE